MYNNMYNLYIMSFRIGIVRYYVWVYEIEYGVFDID